MTEAHGRGSDPAAFDAAPDGTLHISVARSPSLLVVTVAGELDGETAPQLLRALDGQLGLAPGDEVRVDLTRVTFLGVAGARVLAQAGEGATLAGGRMTAVGLNDLGRLVSEVTQLARYVEIRD